MNTNNTPKNPILLLITCLLKICFVNITANHNRPPVMAFRVNPETTYIINNILKDLATFLDRKKLFYHGMVTFDTLVHKQVSQ